MYSHYSISISLCLSLSLDIYTYTHMYVHIHIYQGDRVPERLHAPDGEAGHPQLIFIHIHQLFRIQYTLF